MRRKIAGRHIAMAFSRPQGLGLRYGIGPIWVSNVVWGLDLVQYESVSSVREPFLLVETRSLLAEGFCGFFNGCRGSYVVVALSVVLLTISFLQSCQRASLCLVLLRS